MGGIIRERDLEAGWHLLAESRCPLVSCLFCITCFWWALTYDPKICTLHACYHAFILMLPTQNNLITIFPSSFLHVPDQPVGPLAIANESGYILMLGHFFCPYKVGDKFITWILCQLEEFLPHHCLSRPLLGGNKVQLLVILGIYPYTELTHG